MKRCAGLTYSQLIVLSKLREIGHVNVSEIEEAMGVESGTLTKMESGEHEVPADLVDRYAHCLQKSLGMNKIDLPKVVKELSRKHTLEDMASHEAPVDFLFRYLGACCKGNGSHN